MGIRFLWLAIALFLPSSAGAEDKEKVHTIGEVVVTATKTDRWIEEVPGRIQVIAPEDIQQKPAQKVDELLERLSGLNAIRSNGILSLGASATLRGVGSEQARTLVLVDGIPINKSDTGEVNWNRINLEDIERIEVFKGPASSLYGNNAMGGVINILTKKPTQPIEVRAAAKYGTYNTYGGDLSLSGKPWGQKAGPYYRLSGYYQKSDGYISNPNPTTYTRKRFLEEANASVSLGYRFNTEHEVELAGSFYDDERGEGSQYRAPIGVYRQFDTTNLKLAYQGGARDWQWQLKTFYQLEDYRRVSETLRGTTYTRFDVDSDREDMGVLLNVSTTLFPQNRLTVGIDVKEGRVDAIDQYKTSLDRTTNTGKMRFYALYLQDELDLFDQRLHLIGGIRYDYAEFFGGSFYSTVSPFSSLNGNLKDNSWSAFSPRISARYFFTDSLSSYLSYGRGFRASILDDLCRSGIFWGLYKEANPELEPEKIDTFEFGADARPVSSLKLSASLFYSLGKDFLYFVPTGRTLLGRPLYRRENVGKVEIYGGEFDAHYSITRAISLFANYTYHHSKIKSFPRRPELEGEDLTNNPGHQVKAGISWLNPYLNASAFYHYKGSWFVYTNEVTQTTKKISEYHTVDLKLWREILKNLSGTLSIQNVFDKRTMESDTDLSPGRFIWGEIAFRY